MAYTKGKAASNRVEMVGNIYGKWEVLEHIETKGKIPYYRCLCQGCGKEFRVDGRNIRSGNSSQCRRCSELEGAKKRVGVAFTEERKKNISEGNKGKKLTDEHIAKLSVPRDDLCDPELLLIDPTRMEKDRGLRI